MMYFCTGWPQPSERVCRVSWENDGFGRHRVVPVRHGCSDTSGSTVVSQFGKHRNTHSESHVHKILSLFSALPLSLTPSHIQKTVQAHTHTHTLKLYHSMLDVYTCKYHKRLTLFTAAISKWGEVVLDEAVGLSPHCAGKGSHLPNSFHTHYKDMINCSSILLIITVQGWKCSIDKWLYSVTLVDVSSSSCGPMGKLKAVVATSIYLLKVADLQDMVRVKNHINFGIMVLIVEWNFYFVGWTQWAHWY